MICLSMFVSIDFLKKVGLICKLQVFVTWSILSSQLAFPSGSLVFDLLLLESQGCVLPLRTELGISHLQMVLYRLVSLHLHVKGAT